MEIEGGSTYDINIIFDSKEENEIIDASCSCDKFMNNGFMCEHIYALLQKLKYEKPRKQVISIVDYWQKVKIKFQTLCREFYLDNQNAINKLNPFSFQYMFDYKNKIEELGELNTQTYLCLINKLSIQKTCFISLKSILEEMLVVVNDNIILKIMLEQKIKDLIKIHYNYEMELEDYESHFK